ncbi:MAG: hypothetical protein ABIE47_11325 [Pseudomonadota bacterium]
MATRKAYLKVSLMLIVSDIVNQTKNVPDLTDGIQYPRSTRYN